MPDRVANPVVLIVAIEVSDELQVAEFVMSCEVPSAKVAVTANCCVLTVLKLTEGLTGVTLREVIGEVTTVTVVEPDDTSAVAVTVAEPAAIA